MLKAVGLAAGQWTKSFVRSVFFEIRVGHGQPDCRRISANAQRLALSLFVATATSIGCTDPTEEANRLAVRAKAAIARASEAQDAEARYRDLIEAQETLDGS